MLILEYVKVIEKSKTKKIEITNDFINVFILRFIYFGIIYIIISYLHKNNKNSLNNISKNSHSKMNHNL